MNDYDKQWCKGILDYLSKWGLAHPFQKPVNPERDGAPKYLEIIQHPMDISTMKKKFTQGEYLTIEPFMDDIYLICDNAIKYNGENSMLAFIANDIKSWAKTQYEEKPPSAEIEWVNKLENVLEKLLDHVKQYKTSLLNEVSS